MAKHTFRVESLDANTVVLHFEAELNRINAYTLATALIAFADTAKEANLALNPGYEVEVVVEATGAGSFRVRVATLYQNAKNLFSKNRVEAVIVGVVTTAITNQLWPQDSTQVIINTDEVLITQGDRQVVVPRTVYDATVKAKARPAFQEAANRFVSTIASDPAVEGVGFVSRLDSPKPDVIFTRAEIVSAALPLVDGPPTRVVQEICELEIVKAILKRGRRKWEFVWRGNPISAPVTDNEFYGRFDDHEITIAPGDHLRVELQILQRLDDERGTYLNESYEVSRVLAHLPAGKQMTLRRNK